MVPRVTHESREETGISSLIEHSDCNADEPDPTGLYPKFPRPARSLSTCGGWTSFQRWDLIKTTIGREDRSFLRPNLHR